MVCHLILADSKSITFQPDKIKSNGFNNHQGHLLLF